MAAAAGNGEVQVSTLCRICGQSSENVIQIFQGEGLENNLADKIHTYLPIKVDVNDKLPLHSCFPCASKLITWHRLYQNCIVANNVLNSNLDSEPTPNSVSKTLNNDVNVKNVNSDKKRSPHYRPSFHLFPQSQNVMNNVHFEEKANMNDYDSPKVDNLTLESISRVSAQDKDENPELSEHYATPGVDIVDDIKDEPRDLLEIMITDKFKLPEVMDVENFTTELIKCCENIMKNRTVHPQFEESFFDDLLKMLQHFKTHYVTLSTDCIQLHNEDIENKIEPGEPADLGESSDVDMPNSDDEFCTIIKEKKTNSIDAKMTEAVAKAKIIHNDEIVYCCPICKRNLRSPNTFIFHMRIHSGEKPWVCHLCGKQFRINPGLQRHLRETHQRLKNHTCEVCNQKFTNKQNLIQHRRIHTGERPFVCSKCGKRFKQSGSLHIHNKTHTDHYPFVCTNCDAKFRSRAQLTHHIYKHTGEKPNVCQVCGRAFRVKHDLNIHKLIHSEEKPFACPDCGLSFRQKRYLRNHHKRVHGQIVIFNNE